jgi:hypothetical protein
MGKKLSYTPEELGDIINSIGLNHEDYCFANAMAEMAMQGIDVSVRGTRDIIFRGCVDHELQCLKALSEMGADVKKYYDNDDWY